MKKPLLINLWPLLIISFLIGMAVASLSGRAKAAEKAPQKIEQSTNQVANSTFLTKNQ